MSTDYDKLRDALQRAQRPTLPIEPSDRPAAVFVLFVQRDDSKLVLIRRADRGDPWSGQMAFPGGHIQPDDADALAAAFRETAEEVGIPSAAIRILGDLGVFPTQSRCVKVHVFVGLWDGQDPLHADPDEVAGAYEVPLTRLLEAHRNQGYDQRRASDLGRELRYPIQAGCLAAGDDPQNGEVPAIWGVTARIIHHLLNLAVNGGCWSGSAADGTGPNRHG